MVRDTLVSPIVRYLQLARDFPALPVAAGGPWEPFLTRMRDGLEEFARLVPLPSELDKLDPGEAIEELAVALRFQLRSPESRAAWLQRLTASGELPIALDSVRRQAARERLAMAGLTSDEMRVVLGAQPKALGTAFGNDVGTRANEISWRYTVTFRNADTDGAVYSNIRAYYLAKPGEPTDMGMVTLDDLRPGEVGVFPLCECSRLFSYFIEGDLTLPNGTTGTFVFPDEGAMTPARAGDPNPCEDSWAF
jgi:hypothetical protein